METIKLLILYIKASILLRGGDLLKDVFLTVNFPKVYAVECLKILVLKLLLFLKLSLRTGEDLTFCVY